MPYSLVGLASVETGMKRKAKDCLMKILVVAGVLAISIQCGFAQVQSSRKIVDPRTTNNHLFGSSAIAALGDLGPGAPTPNAVAVGAIGDDDGGTDCGAVYIQFLNGDGSVQSSVKISATQGGFAGPLRDGDNFGAAIAHIGDLGVGAPTRSAVAIGANWDDDGGTDRGAVWILFLNANGTVRASQKISSTAGGFAGALRNGDLFGTTIAHLGDLDGPGSSTKTLAVTAVLDRGLGSRRGAIWILFLSPAGIVSASSKIGDNVGGFSGTLVDNIYFGSGLASMGSFGAVGSGVLTLAAGSPGPPGSTAQGSLWLLLLDAAGTVLSHRRIRGLPGVPGGGWFGYSVATLGDFDGSGPSIHTLAVGSTLDDDGGFNRGAVWLLMFDQSGLVATRKISSTRGTFMGVLADNDRLGDSLAYIGDLGLNAPTRRSLAIGTRDDTGGVDRGAMWLLFLGEGDTYASHALNGVPQTGTLVSYSYSGTASEQGHLAMFLLSCGGTAGFPLLNTGRTIYLTFDSCTSSCLSLPSIFSGVIDASGTASTRQFVFPPLPPGFDIFSSVITLDLQTSRVVTITYPISVRSR